MAEKKDKCFMKGCRRVASYDITFNWKAVKSCKADKWHDGMHFYFDEKLFRTQACWCKKKGHK
jgi:hypothetical protein